MSLSRKTRAAQGVAAACFVIASFGFARPAQAQLNVFVGDLFPDFSALDQNNAPYRLSEHRGKVVLLHVCAMWCPPCQFVASREAALSNLLDAAIGAGNYELVTVLAESALGGPTTQTLAQAWQQRFDTPATLLHANGDRTADAFQLPRLIGLEAFPTFFVLSPDGHLKAIDVGYYGDTTDGEFVQQAQDALLSTPDGYARFLKSRIAASALPDNVARPLMSALDAAIGILSDSKTANDNGALGALNAFVKQIEAMTPTKISSTTAAELISLAQSVMSLIGG